MQTITNSRLEILNSGCLCDVHLERCRGTRIEGSGVCETCMLRKESGGRKKSHESGEVGAVCLETKK